MLNELKLDRINILTRAFVFSGTLQLDKTNHTHLIQIQSASSDESPERSEDVWEGHQGGSVQAHLSAAAQGWTG